jgi:type IV pilus assembly protein PilB
MDSSAQTAPPVTAPPPPAEGTLAAMLLERGYLTAEQVAVAQHYVSEHKVELRQAIIELNLIPAEKLNALAAHMRPAPLPATAENGPPVEARLPAPTQPLVPDRTKQERDIRNILRQIAEVATPSDLVDQIIERGFECRATDIHFDPQEGRYRVRYRIDSQLHDVLELQSSIATAVISRMKVVSDLNIVERRHPQDGRMAFRHADRLRDLRVATIPTTLGEKIVVRIHEALTEAIGLTKLGLEPHQIDQLAALTERPYGAVLVGGPVGAGKTTTLYNCMQRVNLPTRNLMTIEDPIEYRLAGVNQVQVENRISLTFSEGLKAILRQDPDVLMIGEIRDDETAQIGIRAALTGVLVFSTIHASDAASTIGSLYNFGIAGYLLSASLQGVISQRLVRKVCPYCTSDFPADQTVIRALDLDPEDHQGLILKRGQGCPACFQTGYLGRTGIFEVMSIGEELRELVLRQTPKEVLRQVAVDLGMQTLKRSAVNKVLEGTTTVEELHRVVAM